MIRQLTIRTPGRGLVEITREVSGAAASISRDKGIVEGVCTVFIAHTSASLLIQENADPSARADLEAWFDRLAPEGEAWHTHRAEGPDDMPAHLRASVLPTSLAIPVSSGRLLLGRWQGIYVFEHRRAGHERQVSVTVVG